MVSFEEALLTPEYLANPYAYYAALRDAEPVYWSARLNAWMLTRFADVHAALKDPRLISTDTGRHATTVLPV